VNCDEARTLLHGYLDDEIDLVRHLEIEEHLRTCEGCSRAYGEQVALRSALQAEDLYFKAPSRLERRVRAVVRDSARTPWLARVTTSPWAGAVAAAAAAVVLGMLIAPMLFRPSSSERIADDIASAHIRSLMPGHLTDVPSSEQHTVKPWFAGKLDFSPAVVDLSGEGFPLVGGRLDYAAGRPVAALVYRRQAHLINLFVWPSSSTSEVAATADVRQGYNLLHWARGQTNYWVISDLNAAELGQFARLVQDRLASAPAK
jgi:anti-sigma factor RsiW